MDGSLTVISLYFIIVQDNPCGKNNGQCTSICVERPGSAASPLPLNRTCLCSDSFESITKNELGSNDEKCGCGTGDVLVNGTCDAANGNFLPMSTQSLEVV